MLGHGRTLGPEDLRDRRGEGSRHVDREVVNITDKYVAVTEALGRREAGGISGSSGLGEVVGSSDLGEVSGSCGLASSLQATLGRSSREEGEEYSKLDSQASLHVGRGIVKTTNKSVYQPSISAILLVSFISLTLSSQQRQTHSVGRARYVHAWKKALHRNI